MKTYMYRSGDGNDGNFKRHLVNLLDNDCALAAVKALLVNEYKTGAPARAHIQAEVQSEGEDEYGTSAWVHEGPEGECAFGAAWRTAELEPADLDESAGTLADMLDAEAMAYYVNAKQ